MNVFIGFDRRQPIAFQVLAHSIYTRASKPVSITPLVLSQLPIKRRGLTEFTFSRYLVPYLSGYIGRSVFLDGDMLCLTDITELDKIVDPLAAVSVVKNRIRFEWPSLMVFNNSACSHLTTEYIDDPKTAPQSFEWTKSVGELPPEWNHLVGYDGPQDAKIVHFTAGIPCWPKTCDCEYSEEWNKERRMCNSTVSWEELMGSSVHAQVFA